MYIRSARTAAAAATAALTISTQQGEGEDSLMGRPPSSGNKSLQITITGARAKRHLHAVLGNLLMIVMRVPSRITMQDLLISYLHCRSRNQY